MFCIKCGAKLQGDLQFCTECGHKVKTSAGADKKESVQPAAERFEDITSGAFKGAEQEQPPTAPGNEAGQAVIAEAPGKAKRAFSKKKVIFISAALCAAFFIVVFPMLTKSVKLSEHFKATIEGYSGYAVAKVESTDDLAAALKETYKEQRGLDELAKSVAYTLSKGDQIVNGDEITVTFTYDEALAKDLGVKLADDAIKLKAENLAELTAFDPFAELELHFSGYDYYGSAAAKANAKLTSMKYTVAEDGELSNGKDTTVTVTFDQQQAIEAGLLIVPTEKTFPVSGLKGLDEKTVFQDVQVTFSGKSPNLKARVTTTSQEPAFQDITYKATPAEGLSEGTEVTIIATLPKREGEAAGKELAAPSKYIAESTDVPLTRYEDLSLEDQNALEDAAEKLIDERTAGYSSDKDMYRYDTLQLRGGYGDQIPEPQYISAVYKDFDSVFVLTPSGGSEQGNQVVFFYVATLNYSENQLGSYPRDIYYCIIFDDVMLHKDGSAEIPAGSVYRTVSGRYTFRDLYETVIDTKSEEYEVGEALTAARHDERMNEESEIVDEPHRGTLSFSSSRYLLNIDLSGLSAQDIQMAINLMYARHGYIFGDEEIQKYVEAHVHGYEPKIKGGNFDESLFNKYEKFNIKFLADHRTDAPDEPVAMVPESTQSGTQLTEDEAMAIVKEYWNFVSEDNKGTQYVIQPPYQLSEIDGRICYIFLHRWSTGDSATPWSTIDGVAVDAQSGELVGVAPWSNGRDFSVRASDLSTGEEETESAESESDVASAFDPDGIWKVDSAKTTAIDKPMDDWTLTMTKNGNFDLTLGVETYLGSWTIADDTRLQAKAKRYTNGTLLEDSVTFYLWEETASTGKKGIALQQDGSEKVIYWKWFV